MKFSISISYFEIYNELIYDLLTTQELISEPLGISEDTNTKEFIVKEL
jgi:hypothetical protein